jgi:hypothetical protein
MESALTATAEDTPWLGNGCEVRKHNAGLAESSDIHYALLMCAVN